ncbi:hypothetical protein D3C81_657970 [compost metagenome]
MLAAEQGERAGQVDVDIVLDLIAFELAHVHEHAAPGDRVRIAAAGGGKEGVVLAVLAVVTHLEDPFVVQLLIHRGEECLVVEVAAAPVRGWVERAREVGA